LLEAVWRIVDDGGECHFACLTPLAPYVPSTPCGHGRLSAVNVMPRQKFHQSARENRAMRLHARHHLAESEALEIVF
jgi:hypothetical protein